ncbi:EamA family transporter [Streptomyces canus]|uniref:EamA family transporter n=1 Tax=Streptomyces canus TaxID=58343 RepID=UPI0030DECD0D
MHFLNRGLSQGAMSVVVPVSAVTGVGLSVVCGVLLGDRPTAVAWLGIVLSVPALWMVCGGGTDDGAGVPDGLPASAGVALQYIALAQAGASSGLWPVAAGRVAAVLVLLPAAARNPRRLRLTPVRTLQAVLVGAGAALGLILYLLAAQRQLLAVAVVLASLYPALPVILGPALLHERLSRKQVVGLARAGVATVLLSLG